MHESNPIYNAEMNSYVKHPTVNRINFKSYRAIINAIKLCASIEIHMR